MNMATRIRLRWLAVALCLLLPFPAAPTFACCASITVDVSRASDRKPMLKVSITNKGNSELRIGPAQNPWVGPGMVRVIGMRLPDGTAIVSNSRAVVDPSPLAEALPPGKSITDVVDLEEMYPEIAAEIDKGQHEVVVFWTYRFASRDDTSERVGGWVLFER